MVLAGITRASAKPRKKPFDSVSTLNLAQGILPEKMD